MSLQWKLIFQKTKTIRNITLIILGVSVIGIILASTEYSCGIQHMKLISEINIYQNSLDPEFCEVLVEQIDLFDEKCEPRIEILDCG